MRIRWPFTILWTIVCGFVLLVAVGSALTAPIQNCFEYCDLNAQVGRFLIPWVVIVWLAVLAIVSWVWGWATRVRCPRCRRRVDARAGVCPGCAYDLRAGSDAPGGTKGPPGPR